MNTLEAHWIRDEQLARAHPIENRERSLNYLAALGAFVLIFFLLRLAVSLAGAAPPPQRNVLPPGTSTGTSLAWTNFCVVPPGTLTSEPSGLSVLVRYNATTTTSGRTPMFLGGSRAAMVTVYFPTNEPPRRITFEPPVS